MSFGPHGDHRAVSVRNTLLTTPFGVFRLLVELTGPARRHLGSHQPFVYCTSMPKRTAPFVLSVCHDHTRGWRMTGRLCLRLQRLVDAPD